MSNLVIHAISVGNGILAITGLPGVGGDYPGDIAHLREWKPGLVLSMTTVGEMATVGAQTLGNDVQTGGSRWAHLPIQDFGTPSHETEALWPSASAAAVAALRGGGRVLVHCRGGCGRSGMAALRLMVEMGEAPIDAFARLRAVRGCAVETEKQMEWAISGATNDAVTGSDGGALPVRPNETEARDMLGAAQFPVFHTHQREN